MKDPVDDKVIQAHLKELGKVFENMIGLAQDGEFYLSELARVLEPERTKSPLPHYIDRPRLLLVDDDGRLLKSLAKYFRRDFDVTTASALAPAIVALESQPFDVVLTDFHLPDGSGLAILEAAQRHQTGARRLLYTAAADAQIIADAQADELVERLFLKPTTADELRAAIGEMLASGRGFDEKNSHQTR